MNKVIPAVVTVAVNVFLVAAATLFFGLAYFGEELTQLIELRLDRDTLGLIGFLAILGVVVVGIGNEVAYRTSAEERYRLHAPLIEAEYDEKMRLMLEREFHLSPDEVEVEMERYRNKRS